ncbi:MAG: carbohydrate-binding domain-containing protein [Bacteroidales bacterium]|nr:carbohydrate-binding domain-containing protein [Bacteroidales bacterium]
MKTHRLLPFLVALGLLASCGKDSISDISAAVGETYNAADFTTDVYIVFASSSVSITGDTSNLAISRSAAAVTIVNNTATKINYHLSGSSSNGFLKIYSGADQSLFLEGLNLSNPSGAAINIQGPQASPSSGANTFVILTSTSNTISDGTSYTSTPSGEDEKAALFSEGALIFLGSGSLTVSASGSSAIASDDYLFFYESPSLTANSSAGHALRGKDYILVNSGSIVASSSANTKKGLTSEGLVRIDGGTLSVSVTGSVALNSDNTYSGTAGIKAGSNFVMNGGTVTITNSGTGGKGISGDADAYFYGGTVTVTTTGANYGSSSSGNNPGGGPSGGPGHKADSDNSVSSKAIKFDGNLTIAGGSITVSCSSHEGIECKGEMTISGGQVYSYSAADDAINSGSTMTISGGYVCAHSPANDGLDANGNCYIKGGVVYAYSATTPEVAIDANTEGGFSLYVQGGTLIAIGGLERGASLSQSCYQASSWSQNTTYALTVGSSSYIFTTPSSAGTPLVVSGSSTPSLFSGVTANGGTPYCNGAIIVGSYSGGSSVSLSSYSGESGGGGNPGGGPGNH